MTRDVMKAALLALYEPLHDVVESCAMPTERNSNCAGLSDLNWDADRNEWDESSSTSQTPVSCLQQNLLVIKQYDNGINTCTSFFSA